MGSNVILLIVIQCNHMFDFTADFSPGFLNKVNNWFCWLSLSPIVRTSTLSGLILWFLVQLPSLEFFVCCCVIVFLHLLYHNLFILMLILWCCCKFYVGCIQTGRTDLIDPKAWGRSWRGCKLGINTSHQSLVSPDIQRLLWVFKIGTDCIRLHWS